MQRVLVLNGPNLGRLGRREPEIYGTTTFAGLTRHLVETGRRLELDVDVRQTDAEHEMLGWLHEAADEQLPVVLNGAAWTHYSYALADAVAQRTADLIEVHISNIHARDEFRHTSLTAPYATGIIAGLGLGGYDLALAHLAARRDARED
ncbi:type II 3-dehydroquinate dehydratase [Parenemella sanctibonifatiensis]|uniref:3-dehydroquinate dehydratase n=1 Tax=Parenemella sanctibonifatiensis TaxID=2016505 RepID=A0A255E8G0_9ACTN|nr:type II 3-dehydroquinate dehydratase [Parenemella sanctibonifatiensis]OYN87858.1 3-dehydroquinate dehydratase [Parenemella sanctibonifatiensis]OYN92159.1 3-dehydroquinate dehydratase [Parenemella sanctibonifatiensis]